MQTADALDLSSIVAEVGEAIAYVDQDWVLQYCNDVYLQNLGLSRAQVMGKTPFEYAPNFRRSIFFEVCESVRLSGQSKTRIGLSKVLDRWLMIRVFPLRGGVVLFANDASDSAVQEYQLAQRLLKDPLTDLGNKLALDQQVTEWMKCGHPFTLSLIGLDRLKDVNDGHGYAAGDRVLQEVASTLQTATQAGETLFRVSGNEFAVLHEGQAGATRERGMAFIQAARLPVRLAGSRIELQAFCGTVDYPQDSGDFESILKHAALALREARRAGAPEGPLAYRDEFEVVAQTRLVMESEFRTALDQQQFELMIQPKVSLATGGVVGGEALIRWQHPTRGLLAPAAFLGIAQDIQTMVRLDHWVLTEALRLCADLSAQGLSLPLSINLSVDSLADQGLVGRMQDALAGAGVAPGLLEIEIPEGALMHDVALSSKILAQLRAMGIKISVDDFGTGYSSFAYLARFPVQTLKIDRSLISGMQADGANRAIVRAIIQLAHNLALDVVAEGVETQNELDTLRSMDCDSVQGYFYARPLPLLQYLQFARQHPGVRRPNPLAI